ncbi:Protein of unknown function [Bacillus mobilis]|nr:Protein of unknown function [Bacillus mobilis]
MKKQKKIKYEVKII